MTEEGVPRFETFRDLLDRETARHYGRPVIPRISMLYPDDWDRLVRPGREILDDSGSPLACGFADAYELVEGWEHLGDAAYLLQPIWAVVPDEAKCLAMRRAGHTKAVTEIVVPELYAGEPPPSFSEWQRGLDGEAAIRARRQLEPFAASSELLGDTGAPLFHFEFVCELEDPEALQTQIAAAGGEFIDTWSDRDRLISHLDDFASHHIGVFAEHSRRSTPINLGRTTVSEVAAMLTNKGYIVVAHLGLTERLDASLLATAGLDHVPAVDPLAFRSSNCVYVESLSTDSGLRNQGIGGALVAHGLREFIRNQEVPANATFVIAFDTAGPSTEIIPAMSAEIIRSAGYAIHSVRVDSLHFVAASF